MSQQKSGVSETCSPAGPDAGSASAAATAAADAAVAGVVSALGRATDNLRNRFQASLKADTAPPAWLRTLDAFGTELAALNNGRYTPVRANETRAHDSDNDNDNDSDAALPHEGASCLEPLQDWAQQLETILAHTLAEVRIGLEPALRTVAADMREFGPILDDSEMSFALPPGLPEHIPVKEAPRPDSVILQDQQSVIFDFAAPPSPPEPSWVDTIPIATPGTYAPVSA